MRKIERKRNERNITGDMQVSPILSLKGFVFSGIAKWQYSILYTTNAQLLFIASVGCYATDTYADDDAMRIVRWQIAKAWHLVLSHASLTFVIANCTVDKTMCSK